jgi:hypothetical protein
MDPIKQVAPLVRTGGSRHTGLAAPPHRNIHIWTFQIILQKECDDFEKKSVIQRHEK